jgi:ABC-type transport system substrate-binding protein
LTGYCNEVHDRLIEQARRTPDTAARYAIYARLEELLFGEHGEVPITPLYWGVYVTSRTRRSARRST